MLRSDNINVYEKERERMKTLKEKFEKIYNDAIEENFDELNKARNEVVSQGKKHTKIAVCIVLGIFILIFIMALLSTCTNLNTYRVYGYVSLILCVVIIFICRRYIDRQKYKKTNNYEQTFRDKFITPMIKSLNEQIVYSPFIDISVDEFL